MEKTNILLVDDHPKNLVALEAILDSSEYHLVKATSGKEALRCLLNQDFAVILLDVRMPDLDGFETAALIKEREKSRRIPIIFLTAVDKTDPSIFKGYSIGAVDYMFKPLSPTILKSKVAVFVDLYKKQEEIIQLNQTLERRVAERTSMLEIANKKLEEVGVLKGEFFADISHELRTPLSVIRGEAEVTLRGKEKPVAEYKKALQYIILLTEQLNQLVSDLLFLARSESGDIRIDRRQVPLQEILTHVCREGETLAIKKEIKVALTHQDQDILVQGDAQRLKQLFLILVDNAIKYSNPGGDVRISLQRDEKCGRVVVSDDGIGVSEEALPYVFKRFYRAEKAGSMARGGAGLGLSIAKWIVEAHEGVISVSSVVGKGSTVTVALPLSEKTKS